MPKSPSRKDKIIADLEVKYDAAYREMHGALIELVTLGRISINDARQRMFTPGMEPFKPPLERVTKWGR